MKSSPEPPHFPLLFVAITANVLLLLTSTHAQEPLDLSESGRAPTAAAPDSQRADSPDPGVREVAKDKPIDAVRWTAKRRQFTLGGVDYGFTGLPIVYFTPSSGWNYGLRLQWADYSRRPYRYKVTLFAQNSTGRRLNYHVRLKVPRISGSGFGVNLQASMKRDIGARYYGLGNNSKFNRGFVDANDPQFIDEDYYRYTLRSPRLLMSLLREIHGPVALSVGFGLEQSDVDQRGESSFYIDNNTPDDVVDGVTGFISVTVNWDTRDDPTIPRSGTFHEWSYETSRNSLVGLFFEQIEFRRWTFTDKRYIALSQRLNLAHRTALDVLRTVPLYAYGEIGGSRRLKGLGGSDSLRGFDRQRFTDNVRLLTNTELRRHMRSLRMFKQYLEWHTVLFIDSGQAAPGISELKIAEMHLTAGIGQRLYWNSDFVIRADVGLSSEQTYLGFKYSNIF